MDTIIKKIRKRDGRIVDFQQEKITEAIWKAVQAVGGHDRDRVEKLSDMVVRFLEKKIIEREKKKGRTEEEIKSNPPIPDVEEIQDCVEKILIEEGHAKVAKAYILYREEHKKLRDTRKMLLDSQKIIRDYIAKEDWRVYENANSLYSLSGLLWHAGGSVMAYYALNNVYPEEVAQLHIDGDYHIHDLSMSLCGYCAGWSLKQLLYLGFNGVPGKVESAPAKHLRTAVGQIINFIGTLQNEWAGAQAFNSFDTYLAPFVRYDKLNYKEVKQCIQEFVFNMNVASRWGGQTPFSNITLDLTVPEDLKKQQIVLGGKLLKETYETFQDELDIINKAFIEVMLEGDYKGRVFSFPIPTYNLSKDFEWDSEIANYVFKMTGKYGLPYFQNFINSELKPSDVRAMCCHLRLDLNELRRNATGGLFGSGEQTGSVGVVTINLPRIGYLSRDEKEFFEKLDRVMYLARQSLEIKRKIVSRNIERNLLPYTKHYLGNLDNHFSTIGLVGMNEACENFLQQSIATTEGQKFSIRVLKFMLERIKEYQQETGHFFNLEATPAEGCGYRLAKIDREKFPKIITQGKQAPYYTNSTLLPVHYTDDLAWAIKHQEPLQELYTGGTVMHVWLGESIEEDACKLLVKKIASSSRLPYFTITPTFSICQEHGFLKNKKEICPTCKARTEVFSRVVGFLRPVSSWNAGRQAEFEDRKMYNVKIAETIITKNI